METGPSIWQTGDDGKAPSPILPAFVSLDTVTIASMAQVTILAPARVPAPLVITTLLLVTTLLTIAALFTIAAPLAIVALIHGTEGHCASLVTQK